MAENRVEDKYKEINAAVQGTLNTVITYILKFVYNIEAANLGESNRYVGKYEDGRFSLTATSAGNMPQINDDKNLLIGAIEIFEKYYTKGIALSKTWKAYKVLEKNKKAFDIDISDDLINFFNKVEFDDSSLKSNVEQIVTLLELISENFRTSTATLTIEKFYNKMRALKDKLKSIDIKLIKEEVIANGKDLEIPDGIQSDKYSEEVEDYTITEEQAKKAIESIDVNTDMEDEHERNTYVQLDMPDPDDKDDTIIVYMSNNEKENKESDAGSIELFVKCFKETYRKLIDDWCKANESDETKKYAIPVFKLVLDGEKPEKEENTEEAPKDVQQAVDTAAKEIIAVNDKPEDKSTLEKFKKVESDLEKTKELVLKWADPNKNKSMNNKMNKMIGIIGKDIAGQMVPQIWVFNAMNHIKDYIGEALSQKTLLNLLTEEEQNQEQNNTDNKEQSGNQEENKNAEVKEDENKKEENKEKVKKLVDGVDDILQTKKPGDFKSQYTNWLKQTKEILGAALENEKIKEKFDKISSEDGDPYQQICSLYIVLTSKDEENKEDNTQGGEDSEGNSQSDTAGSKPDAESPDEKEDGEGLTAESFHKTFTKRLKQVL